MIKRTFRVGVFDSGIGGLTVLSECVRRLPCVDFIYLGDNERAPYGNRSEEEILSFSREAFKLFRRMGVDAAVIACNTVTAVAADKLRKEFSFPIIGSEPAIKPAAERGGKILVLATRRTAESARLKMLIGRFPECSFTVAPCPRFAGAIEAHFTKGEGVLLSSHLPEGKYDGVVLGCTHYAYFAPQISKYYAAPLYDGAAGVAKRLAHVLEKKGNPNERFSLKIRKKVRFVGNSKKINKKVYFRTFVLAKNEINY